MHNIFANIIINLQIINLLVVLIGEKTVLKIHSSSSVAWAVNRARKDRLKKYRPG